MKKIKLESTDPAEMQNLLLSKYKVQLTSFLVVAAVAIVATCVFYLGNHSWVEVFGTDDQQTPIAFFSFVAFFISIFVLVVLIFVYLQKSVLRLQKEDATSSLSSIKDRMKSYQIKLATILSQIEILKKDSVNVDNLVDQSNEFKEEILLAEKQQKRVEQCLEDLNGCVVNSFPKYLIYLFKGAKGLKIA